MNSSGEIFAMNEESRDFLAEKIQHQEEAIGLMGELDEKEREALLSIPPEMIDAIVSMNRKERRAFYRKVTRKRGRGYTR